MPLYDYDCLACGRRIEVIHGVYAPGPTHCPNCGSGPLKKAIAAPAVHYKGSGWAKRDRRATSTPGASKTAGDAEPGTDTPKPPKDGTAKEDTAASADTATSGTATGAAATTTTGA
jgi:putative FmdB family regulatory protein